MGWPRRFSMPFRAPRSLRQLVRIPVKPLLPRPVVTRPGRELFRLTLKSTKGDGK